MWRSRNSIGSTLSAAATSSMNDSLAKWICGPTGSRRCEVRSGEARSSSGGIVSQRHALVGELVGFRRHAEAVAGFQRHADESGRPACRSGLLPLVLHVDAREALAGELVGDDVARARRCAARARWIEAGPFGSQPVPWSRVYCSAHRLADRLGQHGGVHARSRRRRCGRRSRDRSSRCTCTLSSGTPSIAATPSLHEVRLLRAGPARDLAVLDLDQRAGRPHAGVRLERPFVFGLDHARGAVLNASSTLPSFLSTSRACAPAPCGCGRRARSGRGTAASTFDHSTLSFSAALIASHSLSATTPRKPFSQTTLAPGNVLDRALVDLHRHRAGDRRADHAAMHHARHLDVGARSPPAEHLRRDVLALDRLADDLVLVGLLRLAPCRAHRADCRTACSSRAGR